MDRCDRQPDCQWFNKRPARVHVAAMWAATRIAAGLQNWHGNRCSDGLAILMYHRVAERVPGVEPPTLNVTPDRLRHQLAGLLARGFEAWPLSRIIQDRRESRPIPSNVFAVTFDDGYQNNCLCAWPILRELAVPATIFLATQYLDSDQPFPFDGWSAKGTSRVPASAWRPLTTAQCQDLLAGGLIELGAHTHSHGRFLGRCDEFRRDMRTCLDVIRDRFEVDRPTFAFPYGDFSPELVEATRQLDVLCGLTTRRRRVRLGDDAFQWGRFDVQPTDTPAVLAAKLSGWYTSVAAAGKTLARPLLSPARGTLSVQ